MVISVPSDPWVTFSIKAVHIRNHPITRINMSLFSEWASAIRVIRPAVIYGQLFPWFYLWEKIVLSSRTTVVCPRYQSTRRVVPEAHNKERWKLWNSSSPHGLGPTWPVPKIIFYSVFQSTLFLASLNIKVATNSPLFANSLVQVFANLLILFDFITNKFKNKKQN